MPGCPPPPLIVYTVTETTLASQITGEVVSDTMHTGLTDPFDRTVEYLHDEFRRIPRRIIRFMASTQEVAAA
jgi:hypothetical protein